MVRDQVIRHALEKTNWDLIACSMPSNVLLLTGYWPAVGYAVAVATRDERILLIVPQDEVEFAAHSWADEVIAYCPAPLDRLLTVEEPVFEAFTAMKSRVALSADFIGFEQTESFEPAGYAPNLFRGSAVRLLRRAFPSASLAPADELLAQLRSVKTSAEIGHVATACDIAEQAFASGGEMLRAGATESETAAVFRAPLSSCLGAYAGVRRCDGFTYCMSGPNSCRASGLYSRSGGRTINPGETVVLRCHSYADGYWTDITRTYHTGTPSGDIERMFEAVFAARAALVGAIRPGVAGADLDNLSRTVLDSHGFGTAIRHAAGHGAGFGAVDHTARPRLHPKSNDVLEPGMVMKIDPGVYIEGVGGVRMTDVVAVTDSGADILTRFHWNLKDLIVN